MLAKSLTFPMGVGFGWRPFCRRFKMFRVYTTSVFEQAFAGDSGDIPGQRELGGGFIDRDAAVNAAYDAIDRECLSGHTVAAVSEVYELRGAEWTLVQQFAMNPERFEILTDRNFAPPAGAIIV
jgi:hypothetical protein